jgi:putative protease
MRDYFIELDNSKIDGVIISDPGVLDIAMKTIPHIPVHLSTQANCTNYSSVLFWERIGVGRIILARELTLREISEIRDHTDIPLEVFVHGAMCVSYSGRCILSSVMTGRSSNRGDCSHPCRWSYYLMEENRPGNYYPIYEDDGKTYILNANDMCMIEHIPSFFEAGIDSFKIEGRMKSVHYVATVVKAYRQAIDSYLEDPLGWTCKREWLEELGKVSHRRYSTGFYFEKPTSGDFTYGDSKYIRSHQFVGKILDYNGETGLALVEQRNKFSVGDFVEVMGPGGKPFGQKITDMRNMEGQPIPDAPHPKQKIYIPFEYPVSKNYLLRKDLMEE